MDSSDSKYPWPSTVNVANFVSVKLSAEGDERTNYEIWREQMMCLLQSQDVVGFVDGEIELPSENEESEMQRKLWTRTDKLVKGWILGSIGQQVLNAVWEKETARDVWLELENLFQEEEPKNERNSKYAWPSSVNPANFVMVYLTGEGRINYEMWEEQMMDLLVWQDVAGFVDGEIELPPENEESKIQRKLWRRTDKLVKGWILGSISGEEALHAVWEKETAREVWLELERLFKEEESIADAGGSVADGGVEEDYTRYLPVYKAAQRGDLESAKNFFKGDIHKLSRTFITSDLETVLHAAVMIGDAKANDFVCELVKLMPLDDLAIKNRYGHTALHYAAIFGNKAAATYLVGRYPDLIYIVDKGNELPVLTAAEYCTRDVLEFLITKHELVSVSVSVSGQKPVLSLDDSQLGVTSLLISTIASEFVDIALHLARTYPYLAVQKHKGEYALSRLAAVDTLFPRTDTFTWWQKFIYHSIPSKPEADDDTASDIENSSSDGAARKNSCTLVQIIRGVGRKLEFIILNILEKSVPDVKKLRKKKTRRKQAIELVECLCNQIATLHKSEAPIIFKESILTAAASGISEIVEKIIYHFPGAIYYRDPATDENILMQAVRNRDENVINIFYNSSNRKNVLYSTADKNNNSLLHKCGKIAPPRRLNLVAGAALQMQRELQWFEEMKTFVHPSRRTWPNNDVKTPQDLFTEEHKQLKEDGERWMKDTANACTIAASLIATVMFASAFTVPGGIVSESGIPLFTGQAAFEVFAIADAISLFTSITSLLMFLSILTSRYAEQDFLYVLPKRLSMGLISLFVSISFMLVAFTATLYLLLQKDSQMTWFVILVAAFACFPVASFVLLQFPLLVDVISSTYGPGIFNKKGSGRFLY